MTASSRRDFLRTTAQAASGLAAGGLAAGGFVANAPAARAARARHAAPIQLATFACDVSPPKGHSLCGGWIKPAEVVDDALEALGLVIVGAGAPLVICAVDWTGLLNAAHLEWRKALADAVGATPDRVAAQCVHQHNAPFACLEAERLAAEQGDLPHIVDRAFFDGCLQRLAEAARQALKRVRPVSHIAWGQARVERVASNRRFVGADGRIEHWRGSSSRNPAHAELPEGLIDPWLKTIAFYDGADKLAACHYYATHPMSFYGDGRVTSDFVGLARKALQKDEPDCRHLYFTGCAGNVACGKYNNGSPAARQSLTERLLAALRASQAALKKQPLEQVGWSGVEFAPTPHAAFSEAALAAQIADPKNAVVNRNRPAYTLAWLRRCAAKTPLGVTGLRLNDARVLHLPAESFVEYQLRAQRHAPKNFVATAAYGDGGPWYIPTAEAYPQGGYEVGVAFCEPTIDPQLSEAIEKLLA